MSELVDALKGNFTTVNLGCIGDEDLRLPERLAKTLTVVEVDMEGAAYTTERYYRKISLKVPVSGVEGKRKFRRNKFAGSCSLLDPIDGVVAEYGMERYCDEIEKIELDCKTLPSLLRANGIEGLDMLKTDLEGADFEVIKSCREYLGRILVLQCELRFRPFYNGEPWFHEVTGYLADQGYEVLDITHIDRWKYRNPNWHWQLEGRAAWADFLFVLRPELLPNLGKSLPLAIAKQVILCCMMGKQNYAEYLLSHFKQHLPGSWFEDLQRLVKPKFSELIPTVRGIRRIFRPIELFLKHQIKRSEHVAIR